MRSESDDFNWKGEVVKQDKQIAKLHARIRELENSNRVIRGNAEERLRQAKREIASLRHELGIPYSMEGPDVWAYLCRQCGNKVNTDLAVAEEGLRDIEYLSSEMDRVRTENGKNDYAVRQVRDKATQTLEKIRGSQNE